MYGGTRGGHGLELLGRVQKQQYVLHPFPNHYVRNIDMRHA
jgi:hypothetical protein